MAVEENKVIFCVENRYTCETLFTVDLEGCENVSYPGKLRMAVEYAAKHKISLHEADLARADLSELDLERMELSGAKLHGANLFGTSFYKCDLQSVEFFDTYMEGCSIDFCDLSFASFKGADVSYSDICNSCLEYVDFRDTLIKGAAVRSSNLAYANMSKISVEGVHFTGSIFYRTKFSSVDLGRAACWRKVSFSDCITNGAKNVPAIISGLPYNIIFCGDKVTIGCQTKTIEEWESFTWRDVFDLAGSEAMVLWHKYKNPILHLAKVYQTEKIIKKSKNG